MDFQPTVSSRGEGVGLPPQKNKEYKRCVEALSTIISAIGEKGKVSAASKTQFAKCRKLATTNGFSELADTIDTLHKKYLTIRAQDVKPTAAKDLQVVQALIQGVKREREAEKAPTTSLFMTVRRYLRAPRLRSALAATPLAVLHSIHRLADAALSGDSYQIAGAVTRVGLEALAGGVAIDVAVAKASSLKRHRISQEGE